MQIPVNGWWKTPENIDEIEKFISHMPENAQAQTWVAVMMMHNLIATKVNEADEVIDAVVGANPAILGKLRDAFDECESALSDAYRYIGELGG